MIYKIKLENSVKTIPRVATVFGEIKSRTFKYPHNLFPNLFHHSFQQVTAFTASSQ